MGKLIVFEGTDGSGKSTQFNLLCSRLQEQGTQFQRLVFPQYSEPSSALLRMYLAGEFGPHPTDVNPYAASTFYAVDRYAAWKKVWEKSYRAGSLILSDRYTTSNAVHQGSKLAQADQPAFFDWLVGFEYGKLELPKPDAVIYLDMPTQYSFFAAARKQPIRRAIFMRWMRTIWPFAEKQPVEPHSITAGTKYPA